MSKIIYEPHPVHPSRKAKLQAEGFKILDAIFAPAGTPIHKEMDMPPEAPEHDVALEAAAAAALKAEAEAAAEAELKAAAAAARKKAFDAANQASDTVAVEEAVSDLPAKASRSKKG